jgi:hypothetical protein
MVANDSLNLWDKLLMQLMLKRDGNSERWIERLFDFYKTRGRLGSESRLWPDVSNVNQRTTRIQRYFIMIERFSLPGSNLAKGRKPRTVP